MRRTIAEAPPSGLFRPAHSVLLEPARRHVVDHALTKRADRLVEHREDSCLIGLNPTILRQVRAFALAVTPSEPPVVHRRGYRASGLVLTSTPAVRCAQTAVRHAEWVKSTRAGRRRQLSRLIIVGAGLQFAPRSEIRSFQSVVHAEVMLGAGSS
jgi:hypothetical protein